MSERVSLVIASHRRGAKIGPTLSSVAAQSVPPDEILVLNDGGFAETSDFLAANFPQVRVVNAVGGSAGAARNLGARHATHPWILFLDDDDHLRPHAVETVLRLRRNFPEARAVFADHTLTDLATGEHWPNHHHCFPSFRRLSWVKPVRVEGPARQFDHRLYHPMLHGGLLQQPWLVHRDGFLALGGFDQEFRSHEDWELYLRFVLTHAIVVTDEVIADRFMEAGREHVSRSANLEHTSGAILRKHLRLNWHRGDVRAVTLLLRRLGLHYKTLGDSLFASDRRAGWREYLKSLRAWPFDHVVAARSLVVWPWKLLRG